MQDIDLVYLWVNGNDPIWQAKRNATIGVTDNSNNNCKGRYADNDELKYSLRSVEKFAPWIRKIFIVTDAQVPQWLNTSNPKIQIVDHTEILPAEARPCFNSSVIEHFICNIPGLAERFIYANDDMMLGQPVQPSTFFAPDGLPIFRIRKNRRFRKIELWIRKHIQRRPLNHYNQVIENAATVVEKERGKYYGLKSHHNFDAYLKSDCLIAEATYAPYISPTLCNHVRRSNDIERHLYSFDALARDRVHVEFADSKTSMHLWIHRPDHFEKFKTENPIFFCVNDNEFACDDDRRRAKEFLQQLFPNPSQFELK